MITRRQLVAVAVVLLVVSLALWMSPVHADGLDCGSALSPDREQTADAFGVEVEVHSCDHPITQRQRLAAVLGLLGAAIGFAALGGRGKSSEPA